MTTDYLSGLGPGFEKSVSSITSVSAGSRVNLPGGTLGEGEFPANRLGDSCGGDNVASSDQGRAWILKNRDCSVGNQFLISVRTTSEFETDLF